MGVEKDCLLVLGEDKCLVIECKAHGLRTDTFPLGKSKRLLFHDNHSNTEQGLFQDAVCAVDSNDHKRIKTASVVLAANGGIALVLSQEPQGNPQLPCFVVSNKDIAAMKKFDRITIRLDAPRSREDAPVDGPALNQTMHPRAGSTKSNGTTDYWIEVTFESSMKFKCNIFPCGDLGFRDFPFESHLPAVSVDSKFDVDRKAGAIQSLKKGVENSVCLFDSKSLVDIAAASVLFRGGSALAVIVQKPPNSQKVHVPTFELTDPGAWAKIRSNRIVSVILTTRDGKSASMTEGAETPHGLELQPRTAPFSDQDSGATNDDVPLYDVLIESDDRDFRLEISCIQPFFSVNGHLDGWCCPVAIPEVWRNKENIVSSTQEDLDGHVCFTSLKSRGDITRLQDLVARARAVALFTADTPLQQPSGICVPVFVVDKSFVLSIESKDVSSLRVVFKRIGTTNKTPTCDLDSNNNVMTQVEKKSNWLDAGINYVKKIVGGRKKVFKVDLLDSFDPKVVVDMSKDAKTRRDEALKEAQELLSRDRSCSFDQLVVMADLCDDSKSCRCLVSLVLEALLRFDIMPVKSKLQGFLKPHKKVQEKQPRRIVFDFLVSHDAALINVLASGDDEQMIALVSLLIFCELLQAKHFPKIEKVCNYIDCDFCDRNAQLLEKIVGRVHFEHLSWCCQKDLSSMLRCFREGNLANRPPFFARILTTLVDKSLQNNPKIMCTWIATIEILQRSSLQSEIGRKILLKILSQLETDPLSRTRQLVDLSSVVEDRTSTPAGLLLDEMKRLLQSAHFCRTGIETVMVNPNQRWLLLSPALERNLENFLSTEARKWSLVDRLQVLNIVYRAQKEQSGKTVFGSDQRLATHIALTCSGDSLEPLLRITRDNEDIFRFSPTKTKDTSTLFAIISREIASRDNILEFIQHPDLVDFREIESPTPTLNNAIVQEMMEQISSYCQKSHVSVCTLLHRSQCASTSVQQFACSLFASIFKDWCPHRISDIHLCDQQMLHALFSQTGNDNVDIGRCKAIVEDMTEAWCSDFSAGHVSLSDIQRFRSTLKESSFWGPLEQAFGIALPTVAEVERSELEFAWREDDIRASFSLELEAVGLSVNLVDYFHHYSIDPGDDVLSIVDRYDIQGSSASPGGSASDRSPLAQLRKDADFMSNFTEHYRPSMLVCGHFMANRSEFFDLALFVDRSGPHDMESFEFAVDKALATLSSIVGSDSNLESLQDFLSSAGKCHYEEAFLEMEIDSLMGCKQLGMTENDKENFLVVAFISTLIEKLDRFVGFVKQFCFDFSGDNQFDQLCQNLRDFSTASTHPISSCTLLLEQISGKLFFPSFEISSTKCTSSERRHQLEKLYPLMNLFRVICEYPEVWMYVEEMEWMGHEGLKRFYSEYDNVTQVLLGDSASYEMSLLDSMEPCVRILSSIGGMREITTLSTFLGKLLDSADVEAAIGQTAERKIAQIHGRLSELKHWFVNGVNELAGSYSIYVAVCNSGVYSVDREKRCLCLTFAMTDDASEERLSGSGLDDFIQQLTLTQNDREGMECHIQRFIEQFQVLRDASMKMLDLDSLGYNATCLFKEFICRAGHIHLDQATKLQKRAVQHVQKLQEWLRGIRSEHPLSLLFYAEELSKLYELLSRISSEGEGVARKSCDIARLVSRVSAFTSAPITGRLVELTLKESPEHDQLDGGWLHNASEFLSRVQAKAGFEDFRRDDGASVLKLHSLCCEEADLVRSQLNVLERIYCDRLPRVFEIMDAAMDCTEEQLRNFLERAATFTSATFTIMNLQSFRSNVLEVLLAFLADPEVARRSLQLHLIQYRDFIRASPWVHETSWDFVGNTAEGRWRGDIRHKSFLPDLSIASSGSSASGKTRFIRNRLQTLSADHEVGAVTIHEKTKAVDMIKHLDSIFSSSKRALHISICLGSLDTISDEWSRNLNHFFFSFLVLRGIFDPVTAESYSFAMTEWKVFVEIPLEMGVDWIEKNVPILSTASDGLGIPVDLIVDEEVRRVCTYLRALETGTINRKFDSNCNKRIVLLMDCSGSMRGQPFQDAIHNAKSIFDSHVVEGDEFGVILFDNLVHESISVCSVGERKGEMRAAIDSLPFHGGGTALYAGLLWVLHDLESRDKLLETWVVALTDGQTADGGRLPEVAREIGLTPDNLHIITIGINLHRGFEESLTQLSRKFRRGEHEETKGFFVRCSDGGLTNAFEVVKSRIPVSQTFERDGVLSDPECRSLVDAFKPSFVDRRDMMSLCFWIRFLYRRVKVFDQNESFNFNEEYDNLGSSLMGVMLDEAECLLINDKSNDWLLKNHTQLIYDFADPSSPQFRLVCTSPDDMDAEKKLALGSLRLPGFKVPTQLEMEDPTFLHHLLSMTFNVPLVQCFESGCSFVQVVKDSNFVLTVDFLMKLIGIHERVECRVPCVIEGETGVSKTALAKMYGLLCNDATSTTLKRGTTAELEALWERLCEDGFCQGSQHGTAADDRICDLLEGNDDEILIRCVYEFLHEKLCSRSASFAPCPERWLQSSENLDNRTVIEFARWYARSTLDETFFEINVDSSLTESYFIERFSQICSKASKVAAAGASVIVFLDEINTSSVLGLLKELVVDRSIGGLPLSDNIVILAACNPYRPPIQSVARERDLGKTWVSGHYQVSALPASLEKLKWSFGALSHSKEKEFIYRKMEMTQSVRTSPYFIASMTELIATCHQLMRTFARRNVESLLKNAEEELLKVHTDDRSKSSVSLRDIQRVFAFFEFFIDFLGEVLDGKENLRPCDFGRKAMLLAVAVVYYLRLDQPSRKEFEEEVGRLDADLNYAGGVEDTLAEVMDCVLTNTDISDGIAPTRGLRENLFVVLVCCLSGIPLMIIGPPGTSKTLAMNAVADNSNGSDSMSRFYRKLPRLSLFHYQCSRQSTSKEISAVFQQATQRQERVDREKHRCVVFMDEAGLPEEERESLKVLHYLLEDNSDTKANVGFVAISNHILDAAKSNRCITLLRQEPNVDEMTIIAMGVLFSTHRTGSLGITRVFFGGCSVSVESFVSGLCRGYVKLLGVKRNGLSFNTWFGLRDFVFFLKALKACSRVNGNQFAIAVEDFVGSLERNFNGLDVADFRTVASIFIDAQGPEISKKDLCVEQYMRHPLQVLRCSMRRDETGALSNRPRYKLIIDCSDDDSILRLLKIGHIVDLDAQSLHMLSDLPEGTSMEQLRLISRVKFAAMKGEYAILSQTEPINESFYDLTNQRFREVEGRNGEVGLYANIAVGGVSRRSLVDKKFECLIHARTSSLDELPSPFLNRFEKYRLSIKDVLSASWACFPGMNAVMKQSRRQVDKIMQQFGNTNGRFGWLFQSRTIDSVFLAMLPTGNNTVSEVPAFASTSEDFTGMLLSFLTTYTSIRQGDAQAQQAIEVARVTLPMELRTCLIDCVNGHTDPRCMIDGFNKVLSSELSDHLPALLAIVLQMIVTRCALSGLMQLAPPELIYVRRAFLPPELVGEYFRQEHFSLRRLIASRAPGGVMIVHTRSNQEIHRLPSLPTDRYTSSRNAFSDVDAIMELVHENPDEVVVEHLDRLRSESLLRKSLANWTQHRTRHTFVLLVDMSKEKAANAVNFVRSLVEQILTPPPKSFVLVLHYSPSSAIDARLYPALVIGGWQQVFLDTIGTSDVMKIETCLSLAASGVSGLPENDAEVHNHAMTVFRSMLIKLIPKILTCGVFYRTQSQFCGDCLHSNVLAVERLLLFKDNTGKSIADLITEKFIGLWTEEALPKLLEATSSALLTGRTELSMSLSLQSSAEQLYEQFALYMMAEANQWKNFDSLPLLEEDEVSLFFSILEALPVPPYSEMKLYRSLTIMSRLVPLPDDHISSEPAFPFFLFLSSYFDELVERVEELLREETEGHDLSSLGIWEAKVLRRATFEIQKRVQHLRDVDNRSLVAKLAIDAVAKSSGPLLHKYLRQFVRLKYGNDPSESVVDWWLSRLDTLGSENLLSVHIIARLERVGATKVVADSAMREDYKFLSYDLNGADPIKTAVSALEARINAASVDDGDLEQLWFTLLSKIKGHFSTSASFDDSIILRLRALGLSIAQNTSGMLCFSEKGEMSTEPRGCSVLEWEAWAASNAAEQDCIVEFRLQTLRLFLSPLWLSLSTMFRDDDFMVLVQLQSDGCTLAPSTSTAMLRSVCSPSLVEPRDEVEQSSYGLSAHMLHLADKVLSPDIHQEFAGDGKRSSVPHFIPEWLRSDCVSAEPVHAPLFPVYFAEYRHSFGESKLAAGLFSVVVTELAIEAKRFTSEQLYLNLIREIDDEVSLDRDEFSRDRRLMIVDRAQGPRTTRGTAISAIVVSARVLLFVATLAREVACGLRCVLHGVHARHASQFIESLMQSNTTTWQHFFISRILVIRGEGTLVSCFRENGILAAFRWVSTWSVAMPGNESDSLNKLQAAERDRSETIADEQRKAREFVLCPHCRQPFIVDQANCGQFVCGSDAHNLQGRPQLNGVVVNGVYGCGQRFSLGNALPYRIDQEAILRCEERVVEEREALNMSQQLWTSAKDYHVPVIPQFATYFVAAESSFPTRCLIDCNENARSNKDIQLLKTFWKARDMASKLLLLPDLIEMYLWLHETFRFLITRNQAYELEMDELMNQQLLQRRFDMDKVHHILTIWKRLCVRIEDYLENGVVQVECSEVGVPFSDINKATLVQLLSEGDHMTDGNDYLLLIINDIVQRYNGFVGKIEEIVGSPHGVQVKVINPRMFSSLCGASALLDCPSQMMRRSLTWIAECSWNESSQDFDLDQASQLGQLLFDTRGHRIGSIMGLLREKFCFRKEEQIGPETRNAPCEIDSVSGVYFANRQDFNLVDQTQCSLHALGCDSAEGHPKLLSTFNLKLRGLDYNDLRKFLEGCRNVLLLWAEKSEQKMEQKHQSIASLLNQRDASAEKPTGTVYDIGFPHLSSAQERLILDLDVAGVAELVKFLSYQLGSESYHFASLPQRLSDHLADDEKQHITKAFDDQKNKPSSQLVAEIDDFVKNVLSFYEALVVDASSQKDWSLRDYFSRNNFCDDSDPVFALLPHSCTLRNYVHLRQVLQQLKLSLLIACGAEQGDAPRESNDDVSFYDDPNKEAHWLWREDCETPASGPPEDRPEVSYERSWRLWFEDVLSQPTAPATKVEDETASIDGDQKETLVMFESSTDEVEVVALKEEEASCSKVEPVTKGSTAEGVTPATSTETFESDIELHHDAACRLQRWWRREAVALDALSWATANSFVSDDSYVSETTQLEKYQEAANSIHSINGDFTVDVGHQDDMPIEDANVPDASFVVTSSNVLESSQPEDTTAQEIAEQDDRSRPDNSPPAASVETAALQHEAMDDWHPTTSDAEELRTWLATNRLPASTMEALEEIGVRCTADLQMVIQECPELLESFKPLDRMKLKKGFSAGS